MPKFKTAAIVPVKTFSKAKSRLNLSPKKTEELCKLMLNQVLATLKKSEIIEEVVIVSGDEKALDIGKKYGCKQIVEKEELGVNYAVLLADEYLLKEGFEATLVVPQDIPLIQPEDVESLFSFINSKNTVLVVPSRKFDGTNALFRTPVNIMKTHYDEDSYKIHLSTAQDKLASSALILIRRMMLDVDDFSDLKYVSMMDPDLFSSLN